MKWGDGWDIHFADLQMTLHEWLLHFNPQDSRGKGRPKTIQKKTEQNMERDQGTHQKSDQMAQFCEGPMFP